MAYLPFKQWPLLAWCSTKSLWLGVQSLNFNYNFKNIFMHTACMYLDMNRWHVKKTTWILPSRFHSPVVSAPRGKKKSLIHQPDKQAFLSCSKLCLPFKSNKGARRGHTHCHPLQNQPAENLFVPRSLRGTCVLSWGLSLDLRSRVEDPLALFCPLPSWSFLFVQDPWLPGFALCCADLKRRLCHVLNPVSRQN